MWVPHPNEIQVFPANGTGDMGDVTDRLSICRFGLFVALFVPVFIRGLFTGGTGSAPLSLRVDHRSLNTSLDYRLDVIADVGSGGKANLNWRLPADELYQFGLQRRDVLVLEWTNPDSGTMAWGIEVGLVDASNE